jgi:uncharacterized membrane protein
MFQTAEGWFMPVQILRERDARGETREEAYTMRLGTLA